MKEYSVRISGVTIQNFKNVVFGKLDFKTGRPGSNASLLGLYGQNGSGKTALIDAIDMLKSCLCGIVINEKAIDYINIDAQIATIEFDFELSQEDTTIPVSYQFSIKSGFDDSTHNLDTDINTQQKRIIHVFNEVIKCPIVSESKVKKGRLLDTSSEIISPLSKKNMLFGKNKEIDMELMVAKRVALTQSRSFLFSKELLDGIRKNRGNVILDKDNRDEFDFYFSIIENLVRFGNNELFVIKTSASGLISLNTQPLIFKYKENNLGAIGSIMLPLDNSQLIPQPAVEIVKKVLGNMNIVLCQLVPGLTINLKELGVESFPDGSAGIRFQLMSQKNKREIPLKYESEGIKKIVSILQLLIVVYNNDSSTVAIDELDSGIFEYLLGEILKIIAQKGMGQLIFTSHNLRPLETLDNSYVAFTTTNPEYRYIKMTNIKGTNNLRDCYYRNITLDEQKERLYDPTQNAEIAFAFREAGSTYDK